MNWVYMIIVFIICIPGIYYMYQSEKIYIKEDDVTDRQRLIIHILTAIIFSAIGAFIVPKIDVVQQIEAIKIISYGFGLGVICSIGNLLFYYMYFVPNLTREEYYKIENYYVNAGILSRVFYGGIIEEVIFRWSLLSLFIWLCQLVNLNNETSVWIAITFSSILFALIHIPSIKLVTSKPKTSMYVYAIFGNIWVGVFAGAAFVYGSLVAAIIVHMLFHLLWWPIQIREYAKLQ